MKRKRIRIGQTVGLNGHGDYRDYLEYLHSRFEVNMAFAKTLPADRKHGEIVWNHKRHHYAVVFGAKIRIESKEEYLRYRDAGVKILPA